MSTNLHDALKAYGSLTDPYTHDDPAWTDCCNTASELALTDELDASNLPQSSPDTNEGATP